MIIASAAADASP